MCDLVAIDMLSYKDKTYFKKILSEQIVIFCLERNAQKNTYFRMHKQLANELFAWTSCFTNNRMTNYHASLTLYGPITQYMQSVSHIIYVAKYMLQKLFSHSYNFVLKVRVFFLFNRNLHVQFSFENNSPDQFTTNTSSY